MGSCRRNTTKIFLSAGEASGDLHGSYLVRAIKAKSPQASITCLGGPMLQRSGAELLLDNRDLAVVGLFEVFRHSKVIFHAWQKIKAHLTRQRPQVTVLIDFPDFNFLIARLARNLGSRVFYYITPQVWAWRSGRVHTLRRLVDDAAVILPFESKFYDQYGMKVDFVGHPLLDVLEEVSGSKSAERGQYHRGNSEFLLGLLPGSRSSEIRSLLPVLLDAAQLIQKDLPDISFLLPLAPTLDRPRIEEQIAGYDLPVRVIQGDTYGVIRACDLILTASGTVTLESAILGTPMIIIYRVSNLTYYAGRHLIRVNFVGLPNLIAGRSIVPELLQKDARPETIAAEALDLLMNPERLGRQRRDLARIRSQLGTPGVADRVADLVLKSAGTAVLHE
ncbi:MAG: lipid-A-disaccharide synthase [Desulfoferrobacter sp.]